MSDRKCHRRGHMWSYVGGFDWGWGYGGFFGCKPFVDLHLNIFSFSVSVWFWGFFICSRHFSESSSGYYIFTYYNQVKHPNLSKRRIFSYEVSFLRVTKKVQTGGYGFVVGEYDDVPFGQSSDTV